MYSDTWYMMIYSDTWYMMIYSDTWSICIGWYMMIYSDTWYLITICDNVGLWVAREGTAGRLRRRCSSARVPWRSSPCRSFLECAAPDTLRPITWPRPCAYMPYIILYYYTLLCSITCYCRLLYITILYHYMLLYAVVVVVVGGVVLCCVVLCSVEWEC